jgi:Na+/proline symporter
VFLLGLLTRRVGEWSAITGMVAGLVTILLVRQTIAYTWYVLIGSFATFIAGYLASFVFRDAPPVPA